MQYIHLIPVVFKKNIKQTLNFFGVLLTVNQLIEAYSQSKKESRHILVICHGEVEVPPSGWGAIEKIVSETISVFSDNDYNVTILNSKFFWKWIISRTRHFDLIVLHDDMRIIRTRLLWPRHKLVLFTHYGYAGSPHNWSKKYQRKAKQTFKFANLVICLNQKIYKEFSKFLDKEKLLWVPNGICADNKYNFASFKLSLNKRLVCLGKVEPRKRQFELLETTKTSNIDIDFYGPIVDARVIEELKTGVFYRKKFYGEQKRTKINKLFENYDCLIHVSESEADALVLYEAQLAGLSIIVTENSIGSQDPNLPWIKTIPDNFRIEDIHAALKSILFDKAKVSSYANQNYIWEKQLYPLFNWLKNV